MAEDDTFDTRGAIQEYKEGVTRKQVGYVPVDLTNPNHREAWARFEAEREVDLGTDYQPIPLTRLVVYNQFGRKHISYLVREIKG